MVFYAQSTSTVTSGGNLYIVSEMKRIVQCPVTAMQTLTVVLAMVGKFGITASYGIIYLAAAEVFPTVVR